MALTVKTANGQTFRRCGIVFGATWTTVPDRILATRFGSPRSTKKSPTVGEVLRAEQVLVCEEVDAAKK